MFDRRDKTPDVLEFVLKTVIALGVIFTIAVAVWKFFDYLKNKKKDDSFCCDCDENWLNDDDFASIADDEDEEPAPENKGGDAAPENA